MATKEFQIAIPGQTLGPSTAFLPGPGTHTHASLLHSSILGPIHTSIPPKAPGPSKRLTKITPAAPSTLPTVSVLRDFTSVTGPSTSDTKDAQGKKTELLPEVNSVVLGRVTRISNKQANVNILVVGETVLEGEWQGLIRVQDVRATEKDKVKIVESFRPGDIVRAVVISLGDQSNYYLSTASNHLGVIMATSEAGNAMVPVSWKEFRDPETGESESRKVAKPS